MTIRPVRNLVIAVEGQAVPLIEQDRYWWIRCDKSGEDGVTCCQYGAATPKLAEEMCSENNWISVDGYHECPRHRIGEPFIDAFKVPRAGTYYYDSIDNGASQTIRMAEE